MFWSVFRFQLTSQKLVAVEKKVCSSHVQQCSKSFWTFLWSRTAFSHLFMATEGLLSPPAIVIFETQSSSCIIWGYRHLKSVNRIADRWITSNESKNTQSIVRAGIKLLNFCKRVLDSLVVKKLASLLKCSSNIFHNRCFAQLSTKLVSLHSTVSRLPEGFSKWIFMNTFCIFVVRLHSVLILKRLLLGEKKSVLRSILKGSLSVILLRIPRTCLHLFIKEERRMKFDEIKLRKSFSVSWRVRILIELRSSYSILHMESNLKQFKVFLESVESSVYNDRLNFHRR